MIWIIIFAILWSILGFVFIVNFERKLEDGDVFSLRFRKMIFVLFVSGPLIWILSLFPLAGTILDRLSKPSENFMNRLAKWAERDNSKDNSKD